MLLRQSILDALKAKYSKFTFHQSRFGKGLAIDMRTLGRFVVHLNFEDECVRGYNTYYKDDVIQYADPNCLKRLYRLIEDKGDEC